MTTGYVNLYVEINLFSLVLVFIVLRRTQGVSRMVEQKTFVMGIISEMIFFTADTLAVLIGSRTIPGTNTALLVCKTVYFFSTSMMCFLWFLYFEYLRETLFVKQRRKVRLSSAGIWIFSILLIGNLFGKYLFYVESDGSYHRGSLFILNYILPYSYAFVVWLRLAVDVIKKDNRLSRRPQILLALFPVAPGISGIVQFFYPQVPVACVAMSLATLLLYLNWTEQLISIDPLTNLSNRKQLELSFKQWSKSLGEAEKLGILLVDANNFKHINDTYGHPQGDVALKAIAESLSLGCREITGKAVVARYGGDEFVVLMITDSESSLDELKRRINESLAKVVMDRVLPFELSVSIGTSVFRAGDSLRGLIERADKAMYSEKKQSKQRM